MLLLYIDRAVYTFGSLLLTQATSMKYSISFNFDAALSDIPSGVLTATSFSKITACAVIKRFAAPVLLRYHE